MRYLDSGSDDAAECLAAWLASACAAGVSALRWQTAYFDADGIGMLVPLLATVTSFRGVLGSNDALVAEDVSRLVTALRLPRAGVEVGVVAYARGLFHPKVYHVTRADGSMAAYVGSANLTANALSGVNVEAGVALDERDGDPRGELARIGAAIDRSFAGPRPEVFVVRAPEDVERLVSAGIVLARPPPKAPREPGAQPTAATSMPARRPLVDLPAWPTSPDGVRPEPEPEPRRTPVTSFSPKLVWWKRLTAANAQRVPVGTHPTGKLRLTQGEHDIDHRTWFRRVLFDDVTWTPTTRMHGGREVQVEVATVRFDVFDDGVPLGAMDLVVDHAPHREAGQGNVPTVLGWGKSLSARLREHDRTRWYVVIARASDQTFELRLQPEHPLHGAA